ncbi:MAG TPA: DUF4260 domain-containing protein [Longimicrobiales bacterium]|nr:DUF4260 domain-containing protein [Longimicrobiales bacterium]
MRASMESLDHPVAELPGTVSGAIRHWLRIEGVAALVIAVLIFARLEYSWALFAILFLAPDVSFAGYLAGPRAGAAAYNLLHSHAGPLLLGIVLLSTGHSLAVPLIWVAHVGFDRALGYGLKYPTAFSHTHLGRIGR